MKNKKVVMAVALFAVLAAGTMLLSAFTMPKQSSKVECSEIKACDNWEVYRTHVAYCSGVDGDKGVCEGTDGVVWRNTENGQLAIVIGSGSPCASGMDLTHTTKYDGYNYRFYYKGKYCYIYINVPRVVSRRR